MAVTKTGMLIDERGTNASLPPWPFTATTNGTVAKLSAENKAMLEHAAHYDRQNRTVFEYSTAQLAKSGQTLGAPAPLLANNDARRSEAKRRQSQLAQTKARIVETAAKLLGERDGLKPFDFNPTNASLRAEMRAMSRTMTEKDRNALLKQDMDFVEALVEGKPWLSGLPPSQHQLLYRQSLETRHGGRLQELEDGIRAAELSLQLHTVVSKAIQNELTTVGEPPPQPPPTPADAPAWELLEVK